MRDMSLLPSTCSDELRSVASSLGVTRLGVARVHDVDDAEMARYREWIAEGCNGEMSYLDRYHDVRVNPEHLLPGARSVIVCAFNYYPERKQRAGAPQFAYYSYGKDYHEVVRERLGHLAAYIRERFGGDTRVCVDTAPLPERYWAVEAGLGFRGLNTQLIIPGLGSYFFLGEIITTVNFAPDAPFKGDCGSCGACVRHCPGKALNGGRIDARRCISYLTIEYRGDALPEDVCVGDRVYGCDLCQQVCPYNREAVSTAIEEFAPTEEFLSLDRDAITGLTPEKFNALFRHSAVKRTKLKGLMRNLKWCRL